MRLKIILLFFAFISLACPAFAGPVIENLTVNPDEIWLGEAASIFMSCSIENATIDNVYAKIVGPNIIIPKIGFSGAGPLYSLAVDKSYLDRTGQFNVTVFCESGNQTVNKSSSFTISELTGYINVIQPKPAYIGDVINIYMLVKKDGASLAADLGFDLYIEGQQKTLKINPVYDVTKGWVLKIDSPVIPGTYNLLVNATYGRASIIASDKIEIKGDIEFDIASIDKTLVKPDDEIYIGLKATERGSIIDVNNTNLKIEIGSSQAEIKSRTLSGTVYGIRLKVPYNPPGKYDLKATMEYKNSSLVTTEKIDYVVHVYGKFLDADKKVITTSMKFILDGYEKLNLATDGAGAYSGDIPVGTYDIDIIFPSSELLLKGSAIDEFSDSIHYYSLTNIITPGISNYALYIYDVAIPFSEARIEINYNEGEVDETDLSLFRCSSWNSAKKLCKGEWEETNADIDAIRNTVILTTRNLSIFALGTKEKIRLSYDVSKKIYSLSEPIEIVGVAQDSRGASISNVSIEALIKNTNLNEKTLSDNNGVFRLGFVGPAKEGNYTIYVKAEKEPYISHASEINLSVKASESFSLLFPDSIRIKAGENLTQKIKLVNTGQSDIYDINIVVIGIPEEYYILNPLIEKMSAGEEKTVDMHFLITPDAKLGTSAAAIKVNGSGISREKTFGFTIEQQKQEQAAVNQSQPITGFAIGIEWPKGNEIIYIIIFAAVAFSAAFVIKRRNKNNHRSEIKNALFDIKQQLEKTEPKIITVTFPNTDAQSGYDDKKVI